MSSSLYVTKIHLSGPIDDTDQGVTKQYADARMAEAQQFATDAANLVKSDIMGGLPAQSLDTIKELADYLGDGSISGSVVQQMSALSTSINNEASRASAAESALSSSISSESSRAKSVESQLQSSLSAQISKQASELSATTASISSENAARVLLAGVVAQNKIDAATALASESANRVTDINTVKATATADRDTAAYARTALASSLQTAVSNLQSLESKQTSDNSDRVGDIATEVARAMAAEAQVSEDLLSALSEQGVQIESSLSNHITQYYSYVSDAELQRASDSQFNNSEFASLSGQILEESKFRSDEDTIILSSLQEHKSEIDLIQEQVTALDGTVMYKTGGQFDGDVVVGQLSYLYIGQYWRIAASDDGKRLQFEHSSGGRDSAQPWVVGVPFVQP